MIKHVEAVIRTVYEYIDAKNGERQAQPTADSAYRARAQSLVDQKYSVWRIWDSDSQEGGYYSTIDGRHMLTPGRRQRLLDRMLQFLMFTDGRPVGIRLKNSSGREVEIFVLHGGFRVHLEAAAREVIRYAQSARIPQRVQMVYDPENALLQDQPLQYPSDKAALILSRYGWLIVN